VIGSASSRATEMAPEARGWASPRDPSCWAESCRPAVIRQRSSPLAPALSHWRAPREYSSRKRRARSRSARHIRCNRVTSGDGTRRCHRKRV
jgi:hypothetical protein